MTALQNNRLGRFLSACTAAALILVSTACGTIMHPERKGQTSGQIDAGVAVLNGVGLLFFFIPGVIAYAVDFSNGTIYLPKSPASVDHDLDVGNMVPVVVGVDRLTNEEIRAVVQTKVDAPIPQDAPVIAQLSDASPEYHAPLPR